MWRRFLFRSILGSSAVFLVLLAPCRPALGQAGEPPASALSPAAAPNLTDGVILVAGRTVDVQWTALDKHGMEFAKWQLRRDTVPTTGEKVIHEDTRLTPVFVRDTVPSPGQKYRYKLWNYECWYEGSNPPVKWCGWRSYFDSEVDTSILRGQVTQDVQLVAGTYTGNLFVQPGATLQMSTGTTVNGQSQISARGGRLEITGVTFERTYIQFGQWDRGTSGAGWVRDCTFGQTHDSTIAVANDSSDVTIVGNTFTPAGGSITVNGQASATISDNEGIGVSLDGTASAEIRDNALTSVTLFGASQATIEYNTMTQGVYVNGAGSVAEVRRNTITTDKPTYAGEEGYGIFAYAGTKITAEDNTLTYVGSDEEYGITMIAAQGDAALTARRNKVIGVISVVDDVEATISDNVITRVGLGVSASRTKEITGNTVQDARHVSFYKTVPATATITNNCFRRFSLWVYVEPPRPTYLNLRGNYWGAESGPKISTNPLGTGVRLNGYYVDYDPWDRTGAMCLNEPPPPPVQVGSLELTATPDKMIPIGTAASLVTARVKDTQGNAARGVTVALAHEPAIGGLSRNTCVTGEDGTCSIYYVAPTPMQAAGGVPQVVISGSAGGLSDSTVITLDYLRVVERHPSHGARNLDPRDLSLAATFDRLLGINFNRINTFRVSSAVYFSDGQLPCADENAGPGIFSCKLQDLSSSDTARKGLILTARLKGGPGGVRGVDGSFMAQDVTWQIYTTPELTPSIVATQVADGADLIGSKPTVVRVLGGLSEDTELDWVEANVKLTYADLGVSFTRSAHRFYPGRTGLNEAYLRGNSANFSSLTGEAPLVGPNMVGEHPLAAWVEPVNQLSPPSGVPRRYHTQATARVRPLAGDYARLLVAMYPIVPTDHPLHEFPYPWQFGQEIAGVRASPAVTAGRTYAEKWTPLWGIEQTTGTRALGVWAPLIPNPKNDGAWYLAKLVRHADWQSVPLVPSGVYVLMLVPWEWMRVVNSGTPTFHGPSQHVCVTALDAPAEFNPEATLAWCLAHVHGVPDARVPAGYTLRGYDISRDRLVDSDFPATGYRQPVMAFDRTFYEAGLANLWMDTASYATLMSQMAGGGAIARDVLQTRFAGKSRQPEPVRKPAQRNAARTGGSDTGPLAGTLTVGGEIARSDGAETGAVDIVELPARGTFSAPGGTGEYRLRLMGSNGQTLVEHAFTPEFTALRKGLDYASFLFNVPAPAGVRSVVLVRGTTPLATNAASASAPQVTIWQPAAGSYSGQIQARWTGNDADPGTTLEYTVLFTPDDGGTWQAVALATAAPAGEAQQLTLDTAQYASCTQCRVRVIASDGFQSATATSAAFAVSNPPRVDAVWPPDGAEAAPVWPTVSATFRDAMNAGTITADIFTLTDGAGGAVPGTVAYGAAARRATLQPAQPLAHGATYTARLAGTIRSADGLALGADYVWRFTVEQPPSVAGYALTVTRSGDGAGTVTGSGIDCGSDCSESYPSGSVVTLTATPAAGSTFTGWSGACTNSSGTCAVTMTAAQNVVATFDAGQVDLVETDFGGFATLDPRWFAVGEGARGTVAASAPIAAGQTSRLERAFTGPGYLDFAWKVLSTANVDFLTLDLDGNEIAYRSGAKDWLLMAVPIPPGLHVVGWEYERVSATSPGTNGARVDAVTFTAVAAGEYATLQVQANAAPGGAGRILSSPALLDCGAGSAGRCQATLPYGEHVLFAVPASGSTFAGWTGCDAVVGAVCVVLLGGDRAAAALFEPGKSYADIVQEAYVAYYGRPADLGGQQYWANRLRDEGGNLTNIMQAFGNSDEANRLFGGMSDEDTVTTLYRQILGRDPECQSYDTSCGWGWWVSELASGRRTRQTIALDLLNGARNEDRDTVDNRVRASNAFTGQWSALNQKSSLTPLQVEALWRQFLSYVGSVGSSLEEAIFDAPGWAWKTVGDSQ